MRSHVRSHKLVHVSGVHCHVCAASTSGCAFVYFPVQYCIEYTVVQYLYFKPRMSGSRCKSSNDVAGTAKKCQELEPHRKDEERQEEEEVTEEAKRFTTQEMTRGFSLFEDALLVFEAQDPNVERYTKVAAAIQNAIQCYRVIYDEKKKSYYTDITGSFFQEGRHNRIQQGTRTCAISVRHE